MVNRFDQHFSSFSQAGHIRVRMFDGLSRRSDDPIDLTNEILAIQHGSFIMKEILFATAMTATLAFSVSAQKQKVSPDDMSQGKNDAKSTSSSKTKPSTTQNTKEDPVLSAGTSIEATLQSMVDVRKSKVGDEVVLKTTKAVKENGQVVIAKGTSLIGRITEVQEKTKQNAVSRVSMVFDRLKGKDLDMPVNMSIVSVATAQVSAAAGDLFATETTGTSSVAGNAASGRQSSGGGLLGGVGSTVGGVVNTATQTVGGVTSTAGNAIGGTTGLVGRTVNGLQISQSASGSASSSSTISAAGKNVQLEKGTTFNLSVNSGLSAN